MPVGSTMQQEAPALLVRYSGKQRAALSFEERTRLPRCCRNRCAPLAAAATACHACT